MCPRAKLTGTVQNDVLKEYIARGTYIYPAAPSLRLVADIFRFVTAERMSFNPISISGYHMREAGATAVQEVGFTLANALEYVRVAVEAGLAVDEFGPRLSFFFASHNDLFEETAKFRAARRLWARLVRERFGAGDATARLRFHTQTGGVTLQAQQPLTNVVRVTVQALAAVLGGTQSLHTNGYDEALALPTEQSATLALRTQQIIGYESGVADVVDPLAGSWYVESLTDAIEEGARALIAEVDALGGAARAIERGFFQEAIARSAYEIQKAQECGELVVVGVNRFADGSPPPTIETPDFSALEARQKARLDGGPGSAGRGGGQRRVGSAPSGGSDDGAADAAHARRRARPGNPRGNQRRPARGVGSLPGRMSTAEASRSRLVESTPRGLRGAEPRLGCPRVSVAACSVGPYRGASPRGFEEAGAESAKLRS